MILIDVEQIVASATSREEACCLKCVSLECAYVVGISKVTLNIVLTLLTIGLYIIYFIFDHRYVCSYKFFGFVLKYS